MRKIDSFEGQSRDVLSEFIFEAIKNRLRSNLWVNYKRTAFQSKRYPSLRITFDDDVISIPADDGFSFNLSSLPRRLFKDASILEIKYNGTLPFWVHDIIQRYNLFREPISKYCNAVERLLL